MPYIECVNHDSDKTIKLLIDTGANKNLIKPGLLPKFKETTETKIKNITGCHVINRKGKYNLLGHGIPPQIYYEIQFHDFFEGLLGSEFLAKTNSEINYSKGTITISGIEISFKKFYPCKSKTFNHIITIPTKNNGDWFVPKFSKLINGIKICPGLYRASNNKTTVLLSTASKQPPDICSELELNVNNFETITPIPISSENALDLNTINDLIRTEHLSKFEKRKLLETLLEHQHVLLKEDEKLTATVGIKHKIITKDDEPVYTKSYRYPHHFKKDVEQQIKEMLDNGIIRNSTSPYSSPIWVVPKKSDASGKRKIRVVIDYRKLNEKTVNDKFPIPQIEEILDSLGKSVYFTTLDLKSGFHQIEMDPKHREKTAFSTSQGHFEFLRMPFGLKNAPATFQRAMNHILADYIGTICYVYLDDIIIIGYNLQNHLENISKVLKRLSDFNLKIQLDKCEFLRTETEFLGHVITPNGIKPDPSKITKVIEWKLPTSQKEIKQFLGLTGYYRRFIKDYSKITKPLSRYLKKGTSVQVDNTEYQEAFKNLKEIMTSDQILAYPDFELPFILTTDASNYALGAVLSQVKDNMEKPIAFASRTLNKAEINYSTTEKEALAIIWAVEKFKPYLYGNKFKLITDHKPLTFIQSATKNAKVLRWRLELANYDFEISYKPGKTNVVADALSRKVEDVELNLNTTEENIPDQEDDETIHSAESSQDFFIHFTERPINCYRNQIVFRQTHFGSILTEHPFRNFRRITICAPNHDFDSITNHLKTFTDGKQTAILAPENMLQLIQDVYRANFSESNCHFVITQNYVEDVALETRQDLIVKKEHERAHRGISEVENQIRRSYFFPKMAAKIRQFINSCPICAHHKYERKPYNIKISPRPIESGPFQRVHMDIFGMDKHYYLSLICAFSKHLQLIEINSRNITDIKTALSQYFRTFRPPTKIVCDHEAAFTSVQFQDFLANVGTIIEFASSSESNGQVEKTHSTIIELYNTNKHKFNNSSPEIVQIITSLYNDTVHSATSFTPNEVIFNQGNNLDPHNIAETANKIFEKVSDNLQKAALKMQKYNTNKEDPPQINEDTNVYIKKGTRKKLDPRFTTAKCLQNNDKTIKIPRNVKRNKNKLKRIRK